MSREMGMHNMGGGHLYMQTNEPHNSAWDARRNENSMKIVAFLIFITAVAYAQVPASRTSRSDAERIASAMKAGPKFVTQNATVLDYPTSPGGEFRVLRAGTSRRT